MGAVIGFATLLLGLVTGPRDVELLVADGVAVVEVHLDGRVVATLRSPPWTTRIDFGEQLRPRRLRVVAIDEAGRAMGWAEQLVNYPRPPAAMELVLETRGADGSHPGRLVWEAADVSGPPEHVSLSFDGRNLAVSPAGRFRLPPYDPTQPHHLAARARFGDLVECTAEMVFGGRYGDEVSAQLTAVPVSLERETRMPHLSTLSGWLRGPGGALDMVAVDDPPGDLVVVRDHSALLPLAARFGTTRNEWTSGPNLPQGVSVRFLYPRATRSGFRSLGGDRAYGLFRLSKPYRRRHGSMLRLAAVKHPTPEVVAQSGHQELAKAVAVAGLHLAGRKAPGAVLLLLGPEPEDESGWDPGMVVRFLAALRVPLHVWSIDGIDGQPGATGGWPVTRRPRTRKEYRLGADRLFGVLGSQRILWVRGRHFLHEIEEARAVPGLALLSERSGS